MTSPPVASDLARMVEELSQLKLENADGAARLELLHPSHAPDLYEAAQSDAIWRWKTESMPISISQTETMIAESLAMIDNHSPRVPYAIIHVPTGKAVGSTSYLDIRPIDRNIEIGYTWIGLAHQRTGLNTQCKLLLLAHAFDALHMTRVCLKTDALNSQSRRAIERLGATYEGTLRTDARMGDGRIRDSAYYSVLEREWPDVKRRLMNMVSPRADRCPSPSPAG